MKTLPFIVGTALGMSIMAAAVSAAYPDVSRRAMRDGHRLCRMGKRALRGMW